MSIALYNVFFLLLFIFLNMDYCIWNKYFFLIILTCIVICTTVSETVQSLTHYLLITNIKKNTTSLGHITFWDTEIKMLYTHLLYICTVSLQN